MTDGFDLTPFARPTLEATIGLMQEIDEGIISANLVYGLEGLSDDDMQTLAPFWLALDGDDRRRVLLALTEASESSFELNFWTVGRFALNDETAVVRQLAVDLLWEDTTAEVLESMLAMARDDESVEVRAAAASALGRFVMLGEFEELEPAVHERLQDTLAAILNDAREDIEVRRRALESLANSSHESVEDVISEAYASDEHRWQVSAVFAMGRTADDRWGPTVIEELESEDRELRFEAARAAGELTLEEAVPLLTEIAYEDDVEIRDAAIWSLGEIGGREAMRVLNVLAEEAQESDDDDLLGAVEDALAAASLDNDSGLYLLGFDDQK